ncbi:uncharacterized protein [Eurosta solidaginis]|uniref:uncharacterized protein n=1 Tax=Eurosta solidaginis TaxID=178769 RepID=UPI0035312D85
MFQATQATTGCLQYYMNTSGTVSSFNYDSEANSLQNSIGGTELAAQYKAMRDSKVLIKKTHKIVCLISGEMENDTHTELSIVMPLTSLDSVYDIDYQESMKSYIFTLKGASSHIIGVIRKLFCDNVLFYFNWDGVHGKLSLSKLKLVNSVLFDIFKLQGRIEFEDTMRRYLTLSHNRHKQRRYLTSKSSSTTPLTYIP